MVARGVDALPPLDREQLESAARRVEPEDLALLAMLRGPHVARRRRGHAAAGRRTVARRVERLLGRCARGRRARSPPEG